MVLKTYSIFTFELNHSSFLSTSSSLIVKLPLWLCFRLQTFHSFIHYSVNKIYYVIGIVLGAGNKEMNKFLALK